MVIFFHVYLLKEQQTFTWKIHKLRPHFYAKRWLGSADETTDSTSLATGSSVNFTWNAKRAKVQALTAVCHPPCGRLHVYNVSLHSTRHVADCMYIMTCVTSLFGLVFRWEFHEVLNSDWDQRSAEKWSSFFRLDSAIRWAFSWDQSSNWAIAKSKAN